MATDINLNQLIINKLTQAQYQEAKEAGSVINTELYMMTDGGENFDDRYAPLYTYGTEDLIAGVSPLATGTLYFVYERGLDHNKPQD